MTGAPGKECKGPAGGMVEAGGGLRQTHVIEDKEGFGDSAQPKHRSREAERGWGTVGEAQCRLKLSDVIIASQAPKHYIAQSITLQRDGYNDQNCNAMGAGYTPCFQHSHNTE